MKSFMYDNYTVKDKENRKKKTKDGFDLQQIFMLGRCSGSPQ